MKYMTILTSGVLILTGCTDSDRLAAGVIGGAVIGGAVAGDSDRGTGALVGGVLGGIIASSAQRQVGHNYNSRYVNIIDSGIPGKRYYFNNFYDNYDMAVYPGYFYYRNVGGYTYKCRSVDVYVYDYGRTYHKTKNYCLTNRGWMER
jgi:hypothetical protein